MRQMFVQIQARGLVQRVAFKRTRLIAVLTMSLVFAGDRMVAAESSEWRDRLEIHSVDSPFQEGPTEIRVLPPRRVQPGKEYPVVYLLPVEAGEPKVWGDPFMALAAVSDTVKQSCFFVSPHFSALPWYADHPTDPALRQESHFTEFVLPFVEERYPVRARAEGRFLVGFSKSGWGAWTLILRHPGLFQSAAAWDAPLMVDKPTVYGMNVVLEAGANFDDYHVRSLLNQVDESFRSREKPRLLLLGVGNFADQHVEVHELMESLKIAHVYRDAPLRRHHWESGWLGEAVEQVLARGGR